MPMLVTGRCWARTKRGDRCRNHRYRAPDGGVKFCRVHRHVKLPDPEPDVCRRHIIEEGFSEGDTVSIPYAQHPEQSLTYQVKSLRWTPANWEGNGLRHTLTIVLEEEVE